MPDLKIDAAIEPYENDALVYLPVAPPANKQPGSGMVNFLLTLTYRGFAGAPTQVPPPASLELQSLTVSFTGGDGPAQTYPLEGTLEQHKSLTLHLDELEPEPKKRGSIRIPSPAPEKVNVSLKCKDASPVTFTWPLEVHVSPTVQGAYSFPLKGQDFLDEQYVAPGSGHLADRQQHFAHDIGAVQWNGEKFVNDTGEEGNASRVIWEKPVYAMADGIVITTQWDSPDNPEPGRRAVVRGGAMERGTAGLVAVATDGKNRIFTAVTDADDRVMMHAFKPSADSDTLELLGKSAPQLPFSGDEISLAAMSSTRAVTACAAGGTLLLNSWAISKDGTTINPDGGLTISGTASGKVARISADRFVLVHQPVGTPLEVSVWDLGPTGLPVKASASARAAGSTSLFDVGVMNSTRIVTALRTSSGKLRCVVWDLEFDDKGSVVAVRRGQQVDGSATDQISVAATAKAGQFATATRDDGKLLLSFFDVGTDGAITANHTVSRGPVGLSSIILFKGNAMGMAVQTPAQTVKFIGIENELGSDEVTWTIQEICDFDDPGGAVSAIALDAITTADAGTTAVAALRTATGKLKVVLWRLANNNVLQILHGDELVSYTHLRSGSVEAKFRTPGAVVKEGERLSLAGNAGTSSGPHLHVHAVKFGANAFHLTKAEIPGVIANADSLKGPFRPMVFYGIQATTATIKPGGVAANPEFGPVRGEGFYFDPFFVAQRPPT